MGRVNWVFREPERDSELAAALRRIEPAPDRAAEEALRLRILQAARAKSIENTISPEVIQLALANRLPELAAAFQQKMGEVHVTAIDGANPFGYVAAAVEGVMGLARSAGLELPKKDPKS